MNPDRIEQLSKLADLRDRRVITEEEFTREKRRILDAPEVPSAPRPASGTLGGTPVELPPDSGLVWAILTTLFCFLPFGVVAIVKATSADSNWRAGLRDQAHEAAQSAKNWSIASAVTGLVILLLYVALVGVR
ncbi:MAG: CD225/dispanin family protein [Deltaproteobacteria bacterium]|jgi:hypothetical protein|nr:CD225/dispanin family protein [Deltaproteobacteria bacterium]